MNRTQLKRREDLLARNDAALDRWPQRSETEFAREMTAVAKGLEALADEADATGGDRLERVRTWRYAGNAYFDLGNGRNLPLLHLALAAYQKAEALLEGIDNPIEKAKLAYSYGHVLFGLFALSDGTDLHLLKVARSRYALALSLARTDLPEGVKIAETALANADGVIGLLKKVQELSQKISLLEEELKSAPAAAVPNLQHLEQADQAALAQQLLAVYNKAVQDGEISQVRDQVIRPIIDGIVYHMQVYESDIEGKSGISSHFRELMVRMLHLFMSSSSKKFQTSSDSRAEQVWKFASELKGFLARDSMRAHMGEVEMEVAFDLTKRCAYATTFLSRSVPDDAHTLEYEVDLLRPLALEVRAHAVRNHLMLAAPVWPTPPLPQDPNAVFFSGSRDVLALLSRSIEPRRLKLFAQTALKSAAQLRWDQLRSCHVAVFDFTKYVRPSLGRPVDLAAATPVAAVAYELGIALTLTCAIVIVAKVDQSLPFDPDIEPVRLAGMSRTSSTCPPPSTKQSIPASAAAPTVRYAQPLPSCGSGSRSIQTG